MLKREELNVLFVDDEENVLNALGRFLAREPYSMFFASSGREALQVAAEENIHVVVSDLRMPGMSGLELISELKRAYPDIIRVILSATQDIQQTIASINSGEVFRFIAKPLDPASFRSIILDAVDFFILKNDREKLVEDLALSNDHLTQALARINEINREKERLQEKNRQIERRIGEQFLQADPPENINADIAAVTIPSGHLDGDFFDFITTDDGCFDLITADVMGKGLQSALVGAGIKFIFLKTLAEESQSAFVSRASSVIGVGAKRLETLLGCVHQKSIAKLIQLETFVTLFYSRFDLERRLMTYIDCGHTKAIHYRTDIRQCVFLAGDNLPLGLVEEPSFTAKRVDLHKGDVLLFYSDGVTEAENENGEFYGVDRLAEIVARDNGHDSEQIVEEVKRSVQKYTGQLTFKDDFTCIAVKV